MLASGQEGRGGQAIWQDHGDSVPIWGQELVLCPWPGFPVSLWGHSLVTSSARDCVSGTATKQLRTDLRQGSKYGRARILLFRYQQRLSEVSAGSECRPRGELTLDWNSSLLRASNPPLLPTWFMMLGLVHWGSYGWEARALSLLFPTVPPPHSDTLWAANQKEHRMQGVLLEDA